MPTPIQLYQLQSGSAVNVGELDHLSSGTTSSAKRLLRWISGVLSLAVDFTTPSSAPGSVSIALVERPGSSHAAVSWTALTDKNDDRNWYGVRVVWTNNTTGATVTHDHLDQTLGSDSSPSSTVWAVGDVVHADVYYVTQGTDRLSAVSTTGTVTLDSGI